MCVCVCVLVYIMPCTIVYYMSLSVQNILDVYLL